MRPTQFAVFALGLAAIYLAAIVLALSLSARPHQAPMHTNSNPSCFPPGTPGAEKFAMCPDRIRLGTRSI